MAGWLRALVTVCASGASVSAISARAQGWPPSDGAEPQDFSPQDAARLEQVSIKVAKDVNILREIVKIHHGGRLQEEADLLQQPFSDRLFLAMPSLPSSWPAQLDVLAQKQPEHLPTRGSPAQPSRLIAAALPLTLPATPLRILAAAVPKSDNSEGHQAAGGIFTLGGTVPMWLGILIEVAVLILFIICLCGMCFFLCGQMFNRKAVEVVDSDPEELHEAWLRWEGTRVARRAAKHQDGKKKQAQVCPVCEGLGEVGSPDCAACGGTVHANSSTCEDESHAHQDDESFELAHSPMIGLLSKVRIFKSLPREDRRTLANAFVEAPRFLKGTKLCSQGDPPGSFWVIADGQATVIIDNVLVSTLGVGDTVGELSLMRKIPQPASVIAHTDLTTVLLTREGWFEESGLHSRLKRDCAGAMV